MEHAPDERYSDAYTTALPVPLNFSNTGSNQGAQGVFHGSITINQHIHAQTSTATSEQYIPTLRLILERLSGQSYTSDLRLALEQGIGEKSLLHTAPPIIQLDPAAFTPLALDPAAYGRLLSTLLFSDPHMHHGLAHARSLVAKTSTSLRIQICLAADDEASQAFYWELLVGPDGVPLALSDRILFSRGFSGGDLTPVSIHPKDSLRALIVIPTPGQAALDTEPALDVSAELSKIQPAFSDMAIYVLARANERLPASLEALRTALVASPDIVMFVIRGEFRKGQPHVWLDTSTGGTLCIAGDTLIDLIDRMQKRPRMIILQSEPSAPANSQPALISLGAQLAAAGVGAVLILQPPHTASDSHLLVNFFRELRRDGRVDRALAAARRTERHQPDWWTATLLLRAADGRIWSDETPALGEAVEPPPPPARPPELLGMIGRVTDLAALEAQLVARHRAILVGMPGMGKTTLAAALARRTAPPERIIWHRFGSGEGFETLVWLLAGALAHHSQSGLWNLLEQDRRAGGHLPPVKVLIDYLLQHITDRGYLLCLDDFHLVEDDRQIQQLIERLLPELERGGLRLIVTARRMPAFAQESDLTVLTGLTQADLAALLNARGFTLEPHNIEALWRQTSGNPQLLTLAIDTLRHGLPPAQLIRDVLAADDIERYLLNEVDAGLLPEERAIMESVAVLLEHGGPRTLIETLLGNGARRLLRVLSDRYLLLSQQTAAGKIYRLHTIVQAFYYDDIPKARRQELHHRVADYYEPQADEALRAAIHAARAGEFSRAAGLATTDIWRIISAGQGRALDTLLDTLAVQPLDETRWLAVAFAHGQVASLLRPGEQARACYQAVLDRLGTRLDTPARRVMAARACCGIAELLEQQHKPEALVWLQRGFELLGDTDPVEQAILHRRTAALLTSTGDYDAAMAALTQCLALLPSDADSVRAIAISNLGLIACYRGTLAEGQKHFADALTIYRHSGPHYREVGVLINLGNLQVLQGQWSTAVATYEQAVQQAQELGLVGEQMELQLNLGFLQTRLWEPEQALATLTSLQHKVAEHGSAENAAYLQINLADLFIRLERWEQAAVALAEAERLALALDLRGQEPEIYRQWALLWLAQGDTASAMNNARRALDACSVLGEPLAEGSSLRVWGQALLATAQHPAALEAFAQSTQLLADDAYEQACSQAAWGRALLAEDTTQGHALLETARDTFQRLGARRDHALVCQHLQVGYDTPSNQCNDNNA